MRQICIIDPVWLVEFKPQRDSPYQPTFHIYIKLTHTDGPFFPPFQFPLTKMCHSGTFHPNYCRTVHNTTRSRELGCRFAVAKSIFAPPPLSNLNLRIPQFPPAPKIFLCFGSFYRLCASPIREPCSLCTRRDRQYPSHINPKFGSTKAKRDCGTNYSSGRKENPF